MNGDPVETVDIGEYCDVILLGKLDAAPLPIRTYQEAVAMSDAQRRKNDIGRLERQNKSAERTVNLFSAETTESVLSAIVDSLIADGVDEHLPYQVEKYQGASRLLTDRIRLSRRRRALLAKHEKYIRNNLPIESAISRICRASAIVASAVPFANALKHPLSTLLGVGEVEKARMDNSGACAGHDAMAMSADLSERLLGAAEKLALELGSVLREGFLDHIRFARLVHAGDIANTAYVPQPEIDKATASTTPIMKPLQELVFSMAAPTSSLRSPGAQK